MDREDKREFFRYSCDKPITFRILLSPKQGGSKPDMVSGISQNLSASGILFKSDILPEISSVLELNLDYRTTSICREIEKNAMTVDDKLIGKVVRLESTEDGKYNVGVAFIKKSERLPPEIKDILK